MHFNDLTVTRQSCRNFDPTRSVPQAVLADVCAAAMTAPSACNSQPWKIYLIQSPAALEQCKRAFHAPFVKDAQAIAVLCETKAELKPFVIEKLGDSQYFAQIDTGIVVSYLTLAAADRGVGSCILGVFDQELIRSQLNLPEGEQPRLAVALGYAADGDPIRKKSRKPIEETLIIL